MEEPQVDIGIVEVCLALTGAAALLVQAGLRYGGAMETLMTALGAFGFLVGGVAAIAFYAQYLNQKFPGGALPSFLDDVSYVGFRDRLPYGLLWMGMLSFGGTLGLWVIATARETEAAWLVSVMSFILIVIFTIYIALFSLTRGIIRKLWDDWRGSKK